MNDKPQRHVFVSYVRENRRQVEKLCEELEKHGVKVWLDRKEIKPGARWKDAIREAIRNGDLFIACFSKDYMSKNKSYMNEELVIAIEELRKVSTNRIWFIPALLSECDIPVRSIGAGETLLDIQWVSLYEDWNHGIKQLLEIIKPIPTDVQDLLLAMRSNNIDIKAKAIEALGNKRDASAVPALIEKLKTKDHGVYFWAVDALGKIGDSSAIPALIVELRNNKDRETRNRIADALGKIGPAAFDKLIADLNVKSSGISDPACYALIRIGDKSILPGLLTELKNKQDNVRRHAAYILAEIGNDSTVSALNEALSDENPDVRFAVAYALSKIGNTSSLPALKKALKDDDKIFVDRVAGAISRIRRDAKFG